MNSTIHKLLLSLTIAVMAIATDLPGDAPAAVVTVTVTEPACMTGARGEATPLAIANALATAADVTAAASLVASIMDERQLRGYGAVLDPTLGTTTVRTFANATDCPPRPTFDMSPTGELAKLLKEEVDRLTAENNTDATDTATGNQTQRRSPGPNSYCDTDSDWMLAGHYDMWLDGWGQEADGCGKGILDNLHGQCHGIEGWGCDHWGDAGVHVHFYLVGGYQGCAVDAVYKASPKDNRQEGLCCASKRGGALFGGRGAC